MNRRKFLFSAVALGLFGCAPSATEAAPFQPTRFSVQVHGTGPDVILIPGLTAGRDVWQATARAIPGYRYHLVQVAGFAGEPARGNVRGPVVAPLADEIARYIVDRRLDRPALVGHSMGGTLAMMIGARRPDLVGRVMVVDMLPQPAGLVGGTADNLGPLAESLKGVMNSQAGRDLFASLLTSFSPPDRGNRRSDPDVVARSMQELARINLSGDLRRMRTPLTVVYASPDAQARTAIDRTYASAYSVKPGVKLHRIDNSGHMIMLDQPVRFRQALSDFLGR
jgi:N-formylmaleamate deformylase